MEEPDDTGRGTVAPDSHPKDRDSVAVEVAEPDIAEPEVAETQTDPEPEVIGPEPEPVDAEPEPEVVGPEPEPVAETAEASQPEPGEASQSSRPQTPKSELSRGVSPRDDAERRVKGKSDHELAETYSIAVKAHEEASRAQRPAEVRYWAELKRATVEEAAARSNFGQALDLAAGRRKRREVKRLKRLRAARDELLESQGSDVG